MRGQGSTCPAGGSDACHGSSDAVPLADRGGHDEPEVALAVIGAGGIQDACLLQVHHHGVDGALMAAGVHAHGANQVAAGHRAVVDQAGADRGADDGGQHLGGVRCALEFYIMGGAPVGTPAGDQRRRCRSIRQSAKELLPLICSAAAATASLRVAAWIVRISDSMPSVPIQVASKRKVVALVMALCRWELDQCTTE